MKKQHITKLNIDDTFINTIGNHSKIIGLYGEECTVVTIHSCYRYSINDVIERINNGTYTQYTPATTKSINTNILNNQNNEKIRKTSTNSNRERTSTAISSSTTRQIASSSRLIGNSKTGKYLSTKVGRFEIGKAAISI